MIKKIRKKFIVIATIVIVVVIGALISVLNVTNYIRVGVEADKVLDLLASNNGVMPAPPFTQDDPLENFSPELPFRTRYFTVTISNGEVIATDIQQIAAIDENDAKNYATVLHQSGKNSGYYNDYRFTKIAVEDCDMYIFLDCVNDLAQVRLFFNASIIIGLVTISLIFVLIWVFSSIAVKPIAESYEKQKRFITDANHEIKTPLAIINATNEVMEMKFGENEWSDIIANQVKRLNALTEKLVFLSRMDEENAQIPMAEFNISDTVMELAEQFKNVAIAQQKNFVVEIEPNLNYTGDLSLIGQLISILLENAFKYSTEKGCIDLSLIKRGNNLKIIVGNTVTNVDEKNLDKLFDRFYRPDESRNSETGGYGIGLSVAKSIVNIHNGKITARCDDGDYITFTVTL